VKVPKKWHSTIINDATSAPVPLAIIDQGNLLPGILGLRGIAALAVVLFHLVHVGHIAVPDPFEFIATDFGKGVHLFFILSAFSLMHSTKRTIHRLDWMSDYFVKRFLRIAPLYYCIMAGMILWPRIVSGAWQFDFPTILLNLTFTFGFAPWTGIVWAGWSVGVEMIFYAIFPVLLMTIRTRASTVHFVIASILVTSAASTLLDAHYTHTVSLYDYNWGPLSFVSNLCFFAMGMYAFQVVNTVENDSRIMRWFVPSISVAILCALLFTDIGDHLKSYWNVDMILWGIGLAALCTWQAAWPSRWSTNKIFTYIGERSYSIYLLHSVMIFLLSKRIQDLYETLTPYFGSYAYFFCMALVLIPLIALAEVTYRLIEVPFIRAGRRVISRRRDAAFST
jgi:peptidoglycan/LPS O-acetylase OafA/YrhL